MSSLYLKGRPVLNPPLGIRGGKGELLNEIKGNN
jgi:hypothetical protein